MKWFTRTNITAGIVAIIITFMAGLARADHNQYLFDQANQLYQQEKYQEAISRYQEILQNGYESWQLYYNLGNAYYKTGQIGRAILNYERARKLNPKNEDVQFNLQIANLSVVDKIVMPPQLFITTWIATVKHLWGIETLTFLMIGFYLLVMILVVVKILTRKVRLHRLLNIVLVPAIILLVFFTTIFAIRVHEQNTLRYAIVLVNKVDVLSSPEESGTELFSLHEGVKFKVEEQRGEWAKIRLADGKVGWVKKDVFEII